MQWSQSMGISFGAWLSAAFGISPPVGTLPTLIGTSPGKEPDHTDAAPCFQQGQQFYAGELG